MSDLEKGEDSKLAASCEESYNDPTFSKESRIQNDSTAEKSHVELTQGSPPHDTEESDDSNIVSWDSLEDPANPLNWPSWRRWTLIILVSGVTFMAGLSSSMFAPGVPGLLVEFNSTNSVLGSFVVTVFVLGLAFGPLVWAPLAEIYGRLIVQHVGCAGFLIFTIACAVSKSLSVLIGMRLLQGTFAAASLTNGGAIIADMVRQEERGFAMSMYTLGILLGPSVGPVAGGFLAAAKGWRWVFWVISITVGFLTCLGAIVWRESYAPILLERKAARLRRETGNPNLRSKYDNGISPAEYFKRGLKRPMKMLIFCPTILALGLVMSLAYSYFYLLFTTFTSVFEEAYHFAPNIVGLSYLGTGIGYLIGQFTYARLGDLILKKMAAKRGGELRPEYRLPLCCLGAFSIPIGLFWYGWSAQAKVFWIVPIIGTAFAGFGTSLLFIGIQAYTVDAFTLYAASGMAANAIFRSVMAATVPLAGPKMYEALGLGWGNSLLAFLAVAVTPIPVLLLFYGERMNKWNEKYIKRL